MSILKLESVSYSYGSGMPTVIQSINYAFQKGKLYAIVGKSGAGKTTLLSLLSGLTSPTSGGIIYAGQDISRMNKYEYRSRNVGVVFQSLNLLPHLNALENVVLSMDVSGKKIPSKQQNAMNLLKKVGIDEITAKRRILKLSGGEQQRVAIARALAYNPDIILADEPTGNLDSETQQGVMQILQNLARQDGKCIIIVTHSPEVAKSTDYVFELKKQ